jgi:THAP4-like, heme-binding beta-barrel domain
MTQTTELHEALRPLAGFIGTWRGEGRGFYPTVEDFLYNEEATFGHIGKPFLVYGQRTWSPEGTPLHSETGYWRAVGGGRIEIVLAHPLGIAELSEGTIRQNGVEARSSNLASSATAKEVTALTRSYSLEGDRLTYYLGMAAVGLPLGGHLEAVLERVS